MGEREYTAAKFWVALIGAVLTSAVALGFTGNVQRVLVIALALVTAVCVYLKRNKPLQ